MSHQSKLSSRWALCLAAALAATACVVNDADRESDAIQLFEPETPQADVEVYEVEVRGSATLQYLSQEPATVEILVNGVTQWSQSYDTWTSTLVEYSATVPLSQAGPNEVEVRLTYDGDVETRTSIVTVTEPNPEVTSWPTWTTDYDQTGVVTIAAPTGWAIDRVQYSIDRVTWLDASTTDGTNFTVELTDLSAGDNTLVVAVQSSNLGHTQIDYFRDTIGEVVLPEPNIGWPSWTAEHDQTQTVTVDPAPGWTVVSVQYSVDGVTWLDAPAAGGNGYTVTLTDLDVGDNTLSLRVESSDQGQSLVQLYYDTIEDIAPVFDCTTTTSMLPTNTLYYDNGYEVRTMIGYFGDPAGGHTVSFVLDYTDENGNAFQSPGSIVSYGTDSITVEFYVGSAWCDTDPMGSPQDCDVPYGLTVLVDGNEICNNPDFGNIHNYWDDRRW